MPGYVKPVLKHFKHECPMKPQHSPHPHVAPKYGIKVWYVVADDDAPPGQYIEKIHPADCSHIPIL